MKSIKVNADYEVVLFHGKIAPKQLNDSIEFLALFLEDAPLYSSKKYSEAYLNYIESLTHRRPQFRQTGEFVNWWGEMQNPELERILNSKVTSEKLVIDQGWCDRSYILDKDFDLTKIIWDTHYILKDPFGMSGQKFQILPLEKDISEKKMSFMDVMKTTPVIMEPLLNRVKDFSHYVFPDGQIIAYENFVDHRFQYKGSLFQTKEARLEDLSFYSQVSKNEWVRFKDSLAKIIQHYRVLGASNGFSIDSFVYEEDGEWRVRALSEVNYRRTMGRATYELSNRFGEGWSAMVMMKPLSFSYLHEKLVSLGSSVIVLSPGDTRFSILFLTAENRIAGNQLIERIQHLLSGGEFPVKIENGSPSFFG